MYRIALLSFIISSLWVSNSFAEHIQYVSLADMSGALIEYDDEGNSSWSWTFDLIKDDMALWELTTPTSSTTGSTPDVSTAEFYGSYDPSEALHYVYLRIDPNKISGDLLSNYVLLEVNNFAVSSSWSNPVSLFDWGVPGGTVSDPYGIRANNYSITVTLTTGLGDFGGSLAEILTNVNVEGCFDRSAEVPEPTTMLLFGSGLFGLTALRKKKR